MKQPAWLLNAFRLRKIIIFIFFLSLIFFLQGTTD